MDWTDAGLKDHIKNWLEAVAEERYVRDRRLDPFATSMRDFDDVSPNLKEIRQGGALSLNDPAQRVTDLRAAGLISDDGKTLSPFGEATLAAWENYGVDSDAKSDELARLLLYALEGQRVGDGQVLSFLAYWKDLRTYFDPHKLIENWDALYSLNYLDFARKGFYPGAAYRDGSVPVSEIEFDLVDYSDASGLGPKATEGAVKVQNAIGGKVPRGRHRSTLAMALEIVVSGSVSDTILNNFGIPKTPRTWASFNDSQKEKLLAEDAIPQGVPCGNACRFRIAGEFRRVDAEQPKLLVMYPCVEAEIDVGGNGIAVMNIGDPGPVLVEPARWFGEGTARQQHE